MKWFVVVVIAVAVLIIGFFVYRHRYSEDRLQVDPHARQEIEKAKRR